MSPTGGLDPKAMSHASLCQGSVLGRPIVTLVEAIKSASTGWRICASRLFAWSNAPGKEQSSPKRTIAIFSNSEILSSSNDNSQVHIRKASRRVSSTHLPLQFCFHAVDNNSQVGPPHPALCWFSSTWCYKLTTSCQSITVTSSVYSACPQTSETWIQVSSTPKSIPLIILPYDLPISAIRALVAQCEV